MTDLQWEEMAHDEAWEAAVKVVDRNASHKVLGVQGNEVKPQEGCDK